MEFTEAAVQEFLTSLLAEALGPTVPDMSIWYGQKRFVKGDPATVTCTWTLDDGRKSQGFVVAFSGEAVINFVEADEGRRARLRAAAIEAIRADHRNYDPKASGPYPFLCKIDYLGVGK